MTGTKPARDLKPGDRYAYFDCGMVTILREPEPEKDLFGQDEMKVWARHENTGAEGYLRYGLNAEVPA